MTEDWLLVPPLTGNEPDLVDWLWAQNNEHRVPLPRLVLLMLLKATHGDFRIGMLFNIIALGALSFAMIRVARSLRGGRTSFADAFFPIALLHLGNWENLFWSWQLSFVLSVVLTCGMLLALVGRQGLEMPGSAAVAGICLMLLPLCGGTGLLFVPLLALWLGYRGILHWRAAETRGERRWIGGFLIGSAAVALCLTGLYVVGYERPSWAPPNPGPGASLWATIQFLALGFGPIARSSWILSTTAAISVLLPSVAVVVLGVLRHKGRERHRALGILAFLASMGGFALAVGWGRAGVISTYGSWPLRYGLLATQALCAAFFAWELYGPPKLGIVLQGGLFLAMCFLIPFNTVHGFWWRDWYLDGVDAIEQDLMAGTPCSTLAERHLNFLFHSVEPRELEHLMRMLGQAGMGPFAYLCEDPAGPEDSTSSAASARTQPLVAQEIRYHMPEAGEVFLVWGTNGWNAVPEGMRPTGTEMRDGVMHTPMAQEGDTFVVKIQAPVGTTIDYGFLITKQRNGAIIEAVWDGKPDYQAVVSEDGIIEVQATMPLAYSQTPVGVVDAPSVIQEMRYHMPEASEVFLVWGINGWNAVPEGIRPTGTEMRNGVMHTPMAQEGDTFVVKIQVPAGTTIDYGFLITDRHGIFDVVRPAWDGKPDYQLVASRHGTLEVETTLALANEFSDILDHRRFFLAGIGAFLVVLPAALLFSGLLDERRLILRANSAVLNSKASLRTRRLTYLRDLLRELVARDMKLRYKRSILGVAWSLLNPLIQMLVFTFLFRRLMALDIPNYPSFVFTGVLAWNWFQSAVLLTTGAITGNRELIRRPGFSTAILPVVTVTTNLIHFLLALPILLLFAVLGGGRLTSAVLALPLVIALQFLLTLGLGYLVATFQVTFRDTQHLLGVFFMLLFYLTPVFYDASVIPARFQTLYQLNPMLHLIAAYRAILIQGDLPDLRALLALGVLGGTLLWLGHAVFTRASTRFVEEL